MEGLTWEHPFVNVFKHWNVGKWEKAEKTGMVTQVLVGC